MGDFFQNGVITTIHNLNRRPVEEIEAELVEFAKARPLSLVLPCLYSEQGKGRNVWLRFGYVRATTAWPSTPLISTKTSLG